MKKKREEQKKQYHEIFVPFTDVYRLGGPEVFKNLEGKDGNKNLVVAPMPLIDRLEKEGEQYQGSGAKDTLDSLKKIQKRYPADLSLEGIAIYHFSEGLDICSVDKPLIDTNDFSITELEAKLKASFDCEKSQPTLITTKPRYHMKFGGRGMSVEDPKFLLFGPDTAHEGIIEGNEELFAKLQENGGKINLEDAKEILGRPLYTHQFIRFTEQDFARVSGEYIYNRDTTRIIDMDDPHLKLLNRTEKSKGLQIGSRIVDNILGIKPLDMEQYLATQYGLLPPEVELFIICGGAGSGKTVLSYVTSIDNVLWYDEQERKRRGLNEKKKGGRYERIILLKPFEIVGGSRREVGFLPGKLYDKIKGHLSSYEDAHKISDLKGIKFEEMFLHPKFANDFETMRSKDLKINGGYFNPHSEVIELTYSGFLRGRSFHDTLLLIDEAQNFTPYEMKTIITRVGPGSKAIVMGDPYPDQLDNPLCTPEINGLTHSIKEFLPYHYSALVMLTKLHRSQMAEDAAKWKAYQ
ncbi:MAG: PhoH family protein [Candidatus Woesearchaeota archaeon]